MLIAMRYLATFAFSLTVLAIWNIYLLLGNFYDESLLAKRVTLFVMSN